MPVPNSIYPGQKSPKKKPMKKGKSKAVKMKKKMG
jgi:hypothetical protein